MREVGRRPTEKTRLTPHVLYFYAHKAQTNELPLKIFRLAARRGKIQIGTIHMALILGNLMLLEDTHTVHDIMFCSK
jgi:hypothetical protein